jgi:hypothetical protein
MVPESFIVVPHGEREEGIMNQRGEEWTGAATRFRHLERDRRFRL